MSQRWILLGFLGLAGCSGSPETGRRSNGDSVAVPVFTSSIDAPNSYVPVPAMPVGNYPAQPPAMTPPAPTPEPAVPPVPEQN